MSVVTPPLATKRMSGLRANALAAVVMLLAEYCLGISVNLYSTLPRSDAGKSLLGGFGAAVVNGPVLLTLHALLGTLLLITATSALIRSSRLGAALPIALAAIALAAIVVAWTSGSDYVGQPRNDTSIAMGLAMAVAALCYTLILVLVNNARQPHDAGEATGS